MEAANAAVPRISGAEAIVRYANAAAVFVDVRDSAAIAATGTIKGARRIPRGMLEFMADPATQHTTRPSPMMQRSIWFAQLIDRQHWPVKHCSRGYTNVTNIGGIGDWAKAGGPIEEA